MLRHEVDFVQPTFTRRVLTRGPPLFVVGPLKHQTMYAVIEVVRLARPSLCSAEDTQSRSLLLPHIIMYTDAMLCG